LVSNKTRAARASSGGTAAARAHGCERAPLRGQPARNARRLRSSPALGQPGSPSKVNSRYCAVSGAGFGGGHFGQGASGAQPAVSTISARKALRMWVVYLEVLLALGLAVFIVWFTWPKKRKDDDQ
jgi:hypothetical protein